MDDYSDIIKLPHHVSTTRSHMSTYNRAAQFAPFAALTGYDAKIEETARLTDKKLVLDDDRPAKIDACLQILIDNISEHSFITITHFVKDTNKSGGKYIDTPGYFKMIDESEHAVIMMDGTKILIENIYEIDGDIFGQLINS